MKKSNIREMLEEQAESKQRPDGSAYRSLSMKGETVLMDSAGITAKEAQIAALQENVVPERYCRNQKYFSNDDQIRMLNSSVAVIGQGGLGGTVTEILARIGIGSLTLVDGDVFDESNLNRQLLSNVENIGLPKAEEGRKRVAQINPAVEVRAIQQFFAENNAANILSGCSAAVDCLDSIKARFLLEDGCRKQKIPLVSAAIGGTSGQATVVLPGDEGLKKIYGDREKAPARGSEAQQGTLPYAAILMAAIECAEIVSLLIRGTSRLGDKLLFVNPDEHLYEKVNLR